MRTGVWKFRETDRYRSRLSWLGLMVRQGWRFFLAALAVALVGLLGTTSASAATLPKLETRVGASTPAAPVVVGVHESVSAGQRWGHAPPEAGTVVGCCVAAKT